MPKQTNENQQTNCKPKTSSSLGLGPTMALPLPKVKIERTDSATESPANKSNKSKTRLAQMENLADCGPLSVPETGTCTSPAKGKSPKKATKSSLSSTVKETKVPATESLPEDAKMSVTESLPEVKAKTTGKKKGRVIASRYKESAKSRAVATPTKMSDSSCISINQSKLFSTATSSTPVSAGGKVQDVSVRPKHPPKMAALDSTVRPKHPPKMAALDNTVRPRPAAAPAAAAPGKVLPKIKKSVKTATIKVKPLRAEAPIKTQADGDRERVSDHQLLYNQYLQWTYLARMSEVSFRNERQQLSHQARQLSGLVDAARQNSMDLERKLQAVTLYREMVQLERQLIMVLTAINDAADPVRADLGRLATALDATRSRLQLKGFLEPPHAETFIEELVTAGERCRTALETLDGALSPHANLLQHTAEAVDSLRQALVNSTEHMTSSSEMLQELSSLVLQEASLSLSVGPPVTQQTTLASTG